MRLLISAPARVDAPVITMQVTKALGVVATFNTPLLTVGPKHLLRHFEVNRSSETWIWQLPLEHTNEYNASVDGKRSSACIACCVPTGAQ
jgi:hypothetical protein